MTGTTRETGHLARLSDVVTDIRIGQAAARGLSAVALPKARDQTARFITDPTGPLAENFPQHHNGFAAAARHLRAAELYWITPDMAALAVDAGAQLDTIAWTTQDRPVGCGLALFAGGVGIVTAAGAELPVDAMLWGPAPAGIAVTMFVGRWRVDADVVDDAGLPPLLVARQDDIGGATPEVDVAAIPDESRTPIRALAAAWALMQQPTIAETGPGPVSTKLARSYARAGRTAPAVTVVDLRRIYRPTQPDTDGGGEGRVYRHRWVVRGHWRDQAHGPERALRRRIFVPAYVKGPDGAPLLARERVNVWRR